MIKRYTNVRLLYFALQTMSFSIFTVTLVVQVEQSVSVCPCVCARLPVYKTFELNGLLFRYLRAGSS